MDMCLLCQLWSLNEGIQEYKHVLVYDRHSETNSECSSYSLENGLDTYPSIEEIEEDIEGEEDLLPEQTGRHRYAADSSMARNSFEEDEEVYLEPIACIHSSHKKEWQKHRHENYSQNQAKNIYTYESTC